MVAPVPGTDIFYAGFGDWHSWVWDGFRTRSAQLCRILAASPRINRVFVLCEPTYLNKASPGFSMSRMEKFRLLPFRSRCRQMEEKIYVIDPSRFVVGTDSMKKPYLRRMVTKHLGEHTKNPILWVANVRRTYLMEEFPDSLKIFDAIDDWEHMATYEKRQESVKRGYQTMLDQTDIIYTVSKHLQERFQENARTEHVYHLPNGVDLELFQHQALPPSSRKSRHQDRPPLLTYVGVLSERFDIDLIEQVAKDWPDCHIRLIGPMSRFMDERWKAVGKLSNIEWAGRVDHSKIPELIASSDVLLVPHRASPLSLSMDPLKLYEYLTTGLPIVSTPVPPMEEFSQMVYIGADKHFSEKVGEALEEIQRPDADDIWRRRLEEAKKHSWTSRRERILSDIFSMI